MGCGKPLCFGSDVHGNATRLNFACVFFIVPCGGDGCLQRTFTEVKEASVLPSDTVVMSESGEVTDQVLKYVSIPNLYLLFEIICLGERLDIYPRLSMDHTGVKSLA